MPTCNRLECGFHAKDPFLFEQALSCHHDLVCPKCGTTDISTADLLATIQDYVYGENNTLQRKDAGMSATKPSTVNHPPHYNKGRFEVIDVIEDWELDFHLGNTVKYIARAGAKDPSKFVEDLEKGLWYLQRRIAMEKGGLPQRLALAKKLRERTGASLKDCEEFLRKNGDDLDAARDAMNEAGQA